ncbi:MAG TPA: LysM peptidoglycan-binding domain-containing protein, partial [Sedimentisphaerales bacterium]|nr:LysM peptidoglycan-binding domain-containing protein [Sedimentisphaerales bacterium]
MLKFPNKPHKTGKKRAAVAYVLIAVALILCAGVYACRRRPAEPAASVEPAQASPSPQASPAAPAAVAPPALQTPADVQTSVEATARIAEANAAIAQNDIIRARDILNLVLDMPLSRADRETVKVTMTRLANTWLFGPTVLPGDTLTAIYNVRSGDTLIRIARRHKTDHEILMTINNITNPELLRAGRNIKVVNGP